MILRPDRNKIGPKTNNSIMYAVSKYFTNFNPDNTVLLLRMTGGHCPTLQTGDNTNDRRAEFTI
eukprot:7196650-Karenia_brevis.AAC.1